MWLTKPLDELRGDVGNGKLDPPTTAYAEPFDTYCDMSHLLDAEAYEEEDSTPGSGLLLLGAPG